MNNDSKIITELKTLFAPLNNEWVQDNSLLINYARREHLVFGGSIALAISRKKPHKVPGDIDLFTNDYDSAWRFITNVLNYLSNKKGSYGKVQFNNQTKFTLEGVKNHIRLSGPPFWLPVCVMVLEEPIRQFIWNGTRVQFFDDVVKAAKKVEKIDNKIRIPWEFKPEKEQDVDHWNEEEYNERLRMVDAERSICEQTFIS